jgi:starch synthase
MSVLFSNNPSYFHLNIFEDMEILHVSAECYPMAKVGGLADVVGALPKYQQELGHVAKVVMPMHRTRFLYNNTWEVVHKAGFMMKDNYIEFTIIKEKTNKLGFDLYCVDINGILDREKVYGYDDDAERFTAFQLAVTEWLNAWQHQPDVINVHDHHAGLIPFMLRHCFVYRKLAHIKTVLTIHNAQYQGWMGWDKITCLPSWDTWRWGLLDWENTVNPLASAIRCADRVNTVSPGYLQELMNNANGLEQLFNYEKGKCSGIINGIDYEVWNPEKDTYILDNFSANDVAHGKALNKKKLCDDFGFDQRYPLFIFIGRLVGEKAADLLPAAIRQAFEYFGREFSFLILGSGSNALEHELASISEERFGYYHSQIEYNEKLSHQMYAGADFLLMPSRVEPCGLNQLYAMRYGTVPVVRRTGGLRDTVIDFGEDNGYGVCFNHASVEDILNAMSRSLDLYKDKEKLQHIRTRMMEINNSWETSAAAYIRLYQSI